ncbi:MAG: hypothetical protein EDX89_24530 [Acidobacteria bacterium]|nr:MAG: hypothetical protein EDX89_24530 [Acidobacteriota bacterium]
MRYWILFHGRNLELLTENGGKELYGFAMTQAVNAASLEDAKRKAARSVIRRLVKQYGEAAMRRVEMRSGLVHLIPWYARWFNRDPQMLIEGNPELYDSDTEGAEPEAGQGGQGQGD